MPTHTAPSRRQRWLRRLGAMLCWSSVALVAMVAALCVLSFVRYDVVEHNRGTLIRPTAADPCFHHILHSTSLCNGRGAMVLSWWDYESVGPTEERMRVWNEMLGVRFDHSRPGPMGFRTWFEFADWLHWRFAGFGIEAFNKGGTTGHAVLVPHWMMVVALASPWMLYWATFRTRRRRAGLCARCGYDRMGLGPEVPCPECGVALLDAATASEHAPK